MFWKKKKKEKRSGQDVAIPMSVLARWYMYDVGVEDPNNIAKIIGLVPVSDEGESHEEDASDLRVARLEPYVDFIKMMSELNARMVLGVQADSVKDSGILPPDTSIDDLPHLEEFYKMISYSAIMSTLSAGLELGIIANPGTVGSMEYRHEH